MRRIVPIISVMLFIVSLDVHGDGNEGFSDPVCQKIIPDSVHRGNFLNTCKNVDEIWHVKINPEVDWFTGGERQTTIIKDSVHLDDERLKFWSKLNLSQMDTVYDAIFGYSKSNSHSSCYDPRDGITLYKDREIIGFLEICFECNQLRFWGELKESRRYLDLCHQSRSQLSNLLK